MSPVEQVKGIAQYLESFGGVEDHAARILLRVERHGPDRVPEGPPSPSDRDRRSPHGQDGRELCVLSACKPHSARILGTVAITPLFASTRRNRNPVSFAAR